MYSGSDREGNGRQNLNFVLNAHFVHNVQCAFCARFIPNMHTTNVLKTNVHRTSEVKVQKTRGHHVHRNSAVKAHKTRAHNEHRTSAVKAHKTRAQD